VYKWGFTSSAHGGGCTFCRVRRTAAGSCALCSTVCTHGVGGGGQRRRGVRAQSSGFVTSSLGFRGYGGGSRVSSSFGALKPSCDLGHGMGVL